jgi:hydroxyacyl-ACP dehydratase HTD2-like protein with hotdog domain
MSDLLPDGTDPDQSPGEPWVRRMWAGGKMEFRPWGSSTREGGEGVRWVTGGEGVVCREAIKDVQVKGKEGEEKIFVSIERRVGGLRQRKSVVSGLGGEEVRGLMEGQENVGVVERRDLVFLRERDGPGVKADAAKGKGGDRVVKASGKADFEHRMTPNAALLFRFSALTFNAHRIHLDREYCREVEGHRNLLFHGPLSCVCMLELLGRQLLDRGLEKSLGGQEVSREQIVGFEYRNLAPLYADEEMRICGREKGKGEWELWIEGRDGGLAVRGTARTMTRDEWSERKARMQGDTGTEDQQALRNMAAS